MRPQNHVYRAVGTAFYADRDVFVWRIVVGEVPTENDAIVFPADKAKSKFLVHPC